MRHIHEASVLLEMNKSTFSEPDSSRDKKELPCRKLLLRGQKNDFDAGRTCTCRHKISIQQGLGSKIYVHYECRYL